MDPSTNRLETIQQVKVPGIFQTWLLRLFIVAMMVGHCLKMKKTKLKSSSEKELTRNPGILMNKDLGLTQTDYKFLIYRYPVLRHFIFQCWREGDDIKLLDFLFALETDEPRNH